MARIMNTDSSQSSPDELQSALCSLLRILTAIGGYQTPEDQACIRRARELAGRPVAAVPAEDVRTDAADQPAAPAQTGELLEAARRWAQAERAEQLAAHAQQAVTGVTAQADWQAAYYARAEALAAAAATLETLKTAARGLWADTQPDAVPSRRARTQTGPTGLPEPIADDGQRRPGWCGTGPGEEP